MRLLRRSWQLRDPAAGAPFGPADCLLVERRVAARHAPGQTVGTRLLEHAGEELALLPYPKSGARDGPPAVAGLPERLRTGAEPRTDVERRAAAAAERMHRVLARIEELEEALDDPERVWERLRAAWHRAEDETTPRMAEIVRQTRSVEEHLRDLEVRLRRVLRRTRERVPIDRVQEMDRTSMIWLARQPGRTIAERAGSDQQVVAIARHENFDTLENRVLRSYVGLAARVARQWLREHRRAERSDRYARVARYRRTCRRLDAELRGLGVGTAEPGAPPNYVLIEDRSYRSVRMAWHRLLRQDRAEDDLWAWQAESWTDFCVLALTLSIDAIRDVEVVAQAPIVWLDEAVAGRRFVHDRPLAVYWLREVGLVVEIQARPERISRMQFACRAAVWLRISKIDSEDIPRRIPVWTPHAFDRIDGRGAAAEAAALMDQGRRIGMNETMREGLILMPAHGQAQVSAARQGGVRVQSIALDAVGDSLGKGMAALGDFIRSSASGPA